MEAHDKRRKWFATPDSGAATRPTNARMLEIVKALETGEEYAAIADRYSITPQRVYAIRIAAALPRRREYRGRRD